MRYPVPLLELSLRPVSPEGHLGEEQALCHQRNELWIAVTVPVTFMVNK